MFTGGLSAIVTPMLKDGRLDLPRFRKLIDWHVAEGTDGIVVVGTTGESPTVDFDEHKELIRLAVQHSRGRIPIIAGTGGNSTAEAIELTESARKNGATACLSVVPYYNKPTQEGLYRHFKKIAETVALPVILYNVPGRTVADLQNDTVLRKAQHRVVLEVGDRAPGHVVQDHGQRDRLGDLLEMPVQPLLRGLVVVRHHREAGGRAVLPRRLGELDRLGGRVAAGAGDDRDAAARVLDCKADQ